jgi:hypothetical protein
VRRVRADARAPCLAARGFQVTLEPKPYPNPKPTPLTLTLTITLTNPITLTLTPYYNGEPTTLAP